MGLGHPAGTTKSKTGIQEAIYHLQKGPLGPREQVKPWLPRSKGVQITAYTLQWPLWLPWVAEVMKENNYQTQESLRNEYSDNASKKVFLPPQNFCSLIQTWVSFQKNYLLDQAWHNFLRSGHVYVTIQKFARKKIVYAWNFPPLARDISRQRLSTNYQVDEFIFQKELETSLQASSGAHNANRIIIDAISSISDHHDTL